MKYEIKSGTLGHKYVVQVTFEDKKNLEPLIRVIKGAFDYLEKTRKRLQKAKELEEKERKKDITPGGLLW